MLLRYLSVKTVPEAMKPEEGEDEDEDEDGQGHSVEVDGPAPPPRKSEATGMPVGQLPAPAERSHRTPLKYVTEPPLPVPRPALKPQGW